MLVEREIWHMVSYKGLMSKEAPMVEDKNMHLLILLQGSENWLYVKKQIYLLMSLPR